MRLLTFISHSSQDVKLATALVKLIQSALLLPASSIRCTSVDGCRLPAGVDTDCQIRDDVLKARVLIGLISPTSLCSTYVLFELGARWGRGKPLIPMLAAKTLPEELKGPLAGFNALSCSNGAHLHQLVADLGRILRRTPEAPAAYQQAVEAVLAVQDHNRQESGDGPEPPSVGSSFEPFSSIGPGDNADWALVFRILNSGRRALCIRRAVYFRDFEKRVPILPDAKHSQVCRTGFEVKFGAQWRLLECLLDPGEQAISYVPLSKKVSSFQLPQGLRGKLRLYYEVDGRTASHSAVL